jgi:hypothetical protein
MATVIDSLRVHWLVVNDVHFAAAWLVAATILVNHRD